MHLPDALNEFLSEHALTSARGRTRTPDFYDAFSTWADGRGMRWTSWAEISRELQDLGISKGKHNGHMVFRGIILRDDPKAVQWNCEPYTPRPQKPHQAAKPGRGAWMPGRADWDAMRDDLAGLRADVVALATEVRAGGAEKGTRRRDQPASTVQLSLAGLEPAPETSRSKQA